MTSANLTQSNTRNTGNGEQIGKFSIERHCAKIGKPEKNWFSDHTRLLLRPTRSALLCIALFFTTVLLFSPVRSAAQANEEISGISITSNPLTIGPVSKDLSDLIALIEEMIRILEEAKRKVEEGPDGKRDGPLVFPQPLSALLDGAQAQIDQLFNPLQNPNLTPVDAGSVERFIPPSTLADYADMSLTLADEALAAALSLSQPLRDETIGSRLKTIEMLLPGYLQAGLDAGFD